MITIKFFSPYQQTWKTQQFRTIQEAKNMVAFYLSCGSPATIVGF
jgi:hypothetical protein